MEFYMAPMEGITTAIHRNIHAQHFSGMDRYYAPFFTATEDFRIRGRDLREIAPAENRVPCLIPQLLCNQAAAFMATASQLYAMGYREINLNLGCPSGTVTSKGRGSGFLADPEALDRFFQELFQRLPELPGLQLSVKTRIGVHSPSEGEALLEIYNRYPISQLIVHPRVKEEMYRGLPHLDIFDLFAEKARMPLVYNGNIFTTEDYLRFLQRYPARRFPGIKAVMLGRGAVADPSLGRRLRAVEEVLASASMPAGTGSLAASPESAELFSAGRAAGYAAGMKPEEFRAYHQAMLEAYLSEMKSEQNVLFKLKEFWGVLNTVEPSTIAITKPVRKAVRMADYQAAVRAYIRYISEKTVIES